MVELAMTKVDESDIWRRPNGNSNSLGNQLLHLCGNITQYGISSLGKTKDNRDRDSEFEARQGFSKEELLSKLKETVGKAITTFESASNEELLRTREVQGYTFSGVGVILHVVEHFSYHTGQIAFWVKLLKDSQLGFYDGVDLNTLNED